MTKAFCGTADINDDYFEGVAGCRRSHHSNAKPAGGTGVGSEDSTHVEAAATAGEEAEAKESAAAARAAGQASPDRTAEAVVADLIGNAPHKFQNIRGGLDEHSGPAGAASSFEDDACPDA